MMKRSLGSLLPLLLLLLLLLCGCADPPVAIDRYEPVVSSAGQAVVSRGESDFIELSDADLSVSAMLAGSKNIFVVLLKIENRADADIPAADYAVSLVDGRDEKPLPLVPRAAVIEYRGKLSAGQEIRSGNEMMDLALAQLSGMAKAMGSSHRKEFLQSIDWAIDHYFAFRPVYAHETREGVLCYYADFILEYPLTLKLKLKDKLIDLKFQPKAKQ
ncbi:hypothetical protein ACFL37_01775 [Candidatus Margulisiibacteriota bacterium]